VVKIGENGGIFEDECGGTSLEGKKTFCIGPYYSLNGDDSQRGAEVKGEAQPATPKRKKEKPSIKHRGRCEKEKGNC